MGEILIGVAVLTAMLLLMVVVILAARSKLVSSGDITIKVNGEKELVVPAGDKLLGTLASKGIYLSSACGGGGTCAQCKCQVLEGGGDILATEESHFNKKEVREGYRLSCQVTVKQDMEIQIPEEIFGVKKWECEVISNNNVATFIKEQVLKLPEGEDVNLRAGGYVRLECPKYTSPSTELEFEAKFCGTWESIE